MSRNFLQNKFSSHRKNARKCPSVVRVVETVENKDSLHLIGCICISFCSSVELGNQFNLNVSSKADGLKSSASWPIQRNECQAKRDSFSVYAHSQPGPT